MDRLAAWRKNLPLLLVAATLTALLLLVLWQWGSAQEMPSPKPAPAFTQTAADAWINSPPLRIEDLRGRVVMIEFWTFDCWNCYRSFPWLKELEQQFDRHDFVVVGIHTPEFEHERVRDNVVAKVEEFGLRHPIMLDNDFAYWRAMANRYWPAYYLVDKTGRVRARYVGETHSGDGNARAIEAGIRELLAQP